MTDDLMTMVIIVAGVTVVSGLSENENFLYRPMLNVTT